MYYLYSVPEQKIVKPAGCGSVWKSPKRAPNSNSDWGTCMRNS